MRAPTESLQLACQLDLTYKVNREFSVSLSQHQVQNLTIFFMIWGEFC